MRARTGALLAGCAVLCLALPRAAAAPAETHARVAVLEYRAGVAQGPDAAQRLAIRLKQSAALEIVDPMEARRRDPRVDAETGRCAGDLACTARIGAALGVDEVLLVAMSQLGDVVLAFQRVDVRSAKLETQLSAVVPEGGEITDAQLDTWLKQLYPADVFKRYGYISVKSNVPAARVWINGQDRGLTPLETEMRVRAPQSYKVELAKKGHAPFSARIDVVPDATVEVNAALPEEAQPIPWYKRWYVWGIVGGLAAGAAAGTAVYLSRPDAAHSSGVIVFTPNP